MQFEEMTRVKSRYWNVDALQNDSKWLEIRKKAEMVLKSLGFKKETPNLFWITFIQS